MGEIRELFLDEGMCCDKEMVEDWLQNGTLNNNKVDHLYHIQEQDLKNFMYDFRWNGTAFERGIDDATKIERLLQEIQELKEQVSQLHTEKMKLEIQLGIEPF